MTEKPETTPAEVWVPIPYTPGDPQPRISDGVYLGIRSDGRGGFEGLARRPATAPPYCLECGAPRPGMHAPNCSCRPTTTASPIHIIEFLGDGNALIRRTNGVERLVQAGDVAAVLQREFATHD